MEMVMVTKMAKKLPTDGGPVMVVTAKGVVDTCVEQQDILGTPCPFCWNLQLGRAPMNLHVRI